MGSCPGDTQASRWWTTLRVTPWEEVRDEDRSHGLDADGWAARCLL